MATQAITFEYEGAERSINALIEHLENPKPVLRQFASKVLIPAVRQNIASGGTGWPPYAASTMKRMQASGTSQVTARGTIRANRRKKFASAINKHAKALKRNGWSQDWQNKQDRLEKRIANYDKAIAREQRIGAEAAKAKAQLEDLTRNPGQRGAEKKRERAEKKIAKSKDRIGKRQSETRKLLQAMPGTIRAAVRVSDGVGKAIIYSAAGPVGGAHNYGEGRDPMRQFLPPPNMSEHMETLAKLLERDYDKAWERGK